MIKNILIGIFGLIVGLSLLAGSWLLVFGASWLCYHVFVFMFMVVPYINSIVLWTIVCVASIPIFFISEIVGTNIVIKYILNRRA